jgi:hypothetical protein
MRQAAVWTTIVLMTLLLGCGGTADHGTEAVDADRPAAQTAPASDTAGAEDLVARAVEIAKAIEADPDAAEAILEQHDLTIESYEALMYDISADPELTRAYEAALAE